MTILPTWPALVPLPSQANATLPVSVQTLTQSRISLPNSVRSTVGQPVTIGSLLPQVILTLEQSRAIDEIEKWFKGPYARTQPFKLGGYAGTGKTTLIRHIRDRGSFGPVACCAFTGKAADVLTRKGIKASTIHSLIYNCDQNRLTGEWTFTRKTKSQLNADLIIVDEASMVSKDLLEDLLSFTIPILFVGDPGQLEPVGDDPFLMKNCNFVLESIHRQALDSPIIAFANEVRKRPDSYRPLSFGSRAPHLTFQNKVLSADLFRAADQFICAKNLTRKQINAKARHLLGFTTPRLQVGEKLMCLKNSRTLNCFNGQQYWVKEILDEQPTHFKCKLAVSSPGGTEIVQRVWSEPFYRDIDTRVDHPGKEEMYCDFGYCVTCHKAQGSEWDHVVVVDEWMPPKMWSMARWRYTAITRAAKKLTYCI